MIPYTIESVVQVFERAKNPNAAFKNFLKKEVRKGDDAARFVKELRSIFVDKNKRDPEKVIAQYMPDFESHLLVMAAYAHLDFVNKVAARIVEGYAEQFNQTYESQEKSISIKDKSNFERIAKEAWKIINEELISYEFEKSPFMTNVLLVAVFDSKVIPEILKLKEI